MAQNKFLVAAAIATALFSTACSRPAQLALTTTRSAAASTYRSPASSVDRGELRSVKKWRIAFVPKFKLYSETGHLSGYWQPAWEGAESAGKELGISVELSVAPASGNSDASYVEPQIALVERLLAAKDIDGLVIGPFDSGRLAPVVDKAIASGIPTIAIDTPVSTDRISSFVGFDNYQAGRAIGEWAAHRIAGGKRALVLSGPLDARNAIDRRDGTIDALQEYGVRVLASATGEWEVEPARAVVAGWIRDHLVFEAILASNDNMAMGAAEALKEAKMKGILVTGFDATDEGLAALKDGRMAATVDQSPKSQGRLAVRLMVRLLQGSGPLPPDIVPDAVRVVTAKDL